MAEPTSSSVIALTLTGLAAILSNINPESAVGALCGSLIYLFYARELPVTWRTIKFIISFVMGYMSAPAISKTEFFGLPPIEMPTLAAFVASALIVTVTMSAIRGRDKQE